MWLLKFLPNWIFYGILLAGLAGLASTYLMKFIPFVFMYRQTIQLVSVGAIIIGTFMSGAIYDNDAWEARVREMQAKVEIAEKQSQIANQMIDTKVEEEVSKIKEKQVVITKYINKEIVKYDSTCVIPNEFISIVNEAAKK
jgi:hypothetical protein